MDGDRKIAERISKDAAVMITTLYVQEANISDLWRLDVVGISEPIEKASRFVREERTREFLKETAKLNDEGRYEVRLPWTEDHAPVSSNYNTARLRLKKCIERLTSQYLLKAYDEVFKQWLTEGIIERVPDGEVDKLGHYLPHRPVVKMHSTTKIRPVFDASACNKGYPSLNQCLEKGPNLIELVPSALNKFREGEIGVVSDIKKAFLQIVISKADRDYLRFFWIVNNEIVIFRHRRVVFGLTCSPFLLAAIIELHLSNVDENPELIGKLKGSFYVDNCVTSVNSEDELRMFREEATSAMASGGFDLRGWESSGDMSENETTLVLGVLWNKERDTIAINPAILRDNYPEVVTKREILSTTHKVFDLIGFTCPASLLPKLLLKELWTEKIDWDTEISNSRRDRFLNWLKELPMLNTIEISRRLGRGDLTLHTFCDASASAYAAVVFARIENLETRAIEVKLLSARSRISPEKATIPRLELMAATIAVRLTDAVVKSLTRKIVKSTFWSDSTTVLAWIKRDMQWGTFVWNRVKEIRSLSAENDWKYVPGVLNPADLPSRGCNPSQLAVSEWWLGPKWLYESESNWPAGEHKFKEEEIKSEIKKSSLTHLINTGDREFKVGEFFSSYSRLIRFLAWVNRFLANCREQKNRTTPKITKVAYLTKEEKNKVRLTFNELRTAEIKLLKHLQDHMFTTVTKNKLSFFKIMKNRDGLYVLKTKIFNRIDASSFLCPILLDNNNDVIYMLVRETHEDMGHAGMQIIMGHLREKFWIISHRKTIKSVISNCVTCKRQKVKRMECEAPPLPPDRVRNAAIFETVGIDYAGPLILKGGGKGWICIFTCAIYRAVHLELASTLATQGFLECLRRFIARRGRPSSIYCDNGTNFMSASNMLRKLDWEKITKNSSISQIEWYFNPPAAPWWGGWWERLIGILKSLLRKILGKASLSYESLYTVLCDTEAIINSHPLTYISEDPNDLKPLSPSMFLQEIRECGVSDCDMLYRKKLCKKFIHRQKILEDLRKRFRTEYLGHLLLKNGKREMRKVKVGDVVLVGDDIHRRIDWPLARVIEAVPGRDGNERVFVLKTKNGIFKIPIQRIYPLELSTEESGFTKSLYERATSEQLNDKKDKDNFKNEGEPVDCEEVECDSNVVTTRSGRRSRKPERFKY